MKSSNDRKREIRKGFSIYKRFIFTFRRGCSSCSVVFSGLIFGFLLFQAIFIYTHHHDYHSKSSDVKDSHSLSQKLPSRLDLLKSTEKQQYLRKKSTTSSESLARMTAEIPNNIQQLIAASKSNQKKSNLATNNSNISLK